MKTGKLVLSTLLGLSTVSVVRCAWLDLSLDAIKDLTVGTQKAVDDFANLFVTPERKCERMTCTKADKQFALDEQGKYVAVRPIQQPIHPMQQQMQLMQPMVQPIQPMRPIMQPMKPMQPMQQHIQPMQPMMQPMQPMQRYPLPMQPTHQPMRPPMPVVQIFPFGDNGGECKMKSDQLLFGVPISLCTVNFTRSGIFDGTFNTYKTIKGIVTLAKVKPELLDNRINIVVKDQMEISIAVPPKTEQFLIFSPTTGKPCHISTDVSTTKPPTSEFMTAMENSYNWFRKKWNKVHYDCYDDFCGNKEELTRSVVVTIKILQVTLKKKWNRAINDEEPPSDKRDILDYLIGKMKDFSGKFKKDSSRTKSRPTTAPTSIWNMIMKTPLATETPTMINMPTKIEWPEKGERPMMTWKSTTVPTMLKIPSVINGRSSVIGNIPPMIKILNEMPFMADMPTTTVKSTMKTTTEPTTMKISSNINNISSILTNMASKVNILTKIEIPSTTEMSTTTEKSTTKTTTEQKTVKISSNINNISSIFKNIASKVNILRKIEMPSTTEMPTTTEESTTKTTTEQTTMKMSPIISDMAPVIEMPADTTPMTTMKSTTEMTTIPTTTIADLTSTASNQVTYPIT